MPTASATVTVYGQDNGATDNGGVDVSTANTFTITLLAVNNPPTLATIDNQSIAGRCGDAIGEPERHQFRSA